MSSIDKKNVLLITFDQWPGNNFGCAGHKDILTPTLDELAACGVRFKNAYSPTPACIPARRELMLGVSARKHGDRIFQKGLRMPENMPTLAHTFRDNGYQTFAVGKLHVFPQRDRIGFDDVFLYEEGRHEHGLVQDDYERYLAHKGYFGMEFSHGMCNNNYMYRPWNLPEECHPTNWVARQMCEQIKRKDPTRPAFWYMSFAGPHPPLVPLRDYLNMYINHDVELPYMGEWTKDKEKLPFSWTFYSTLRNVGNNRQVKDALRAVYAMCTHIDHQIRTVIGTLSEEKLLDDTIILITADHGDMLGNHGIWCKNVFYEDSCKVPFIIVPALDCTLFNVGTVDDRLVELRDVMPTLLDLAGIEIPETVDGISLAQDNRREYIYGELWEDERITRMIRTKDHKLIYYPYENIFQMFDLVNDSKELHNVFDDERDDDVKKDLIKKLGASLYGSDLKMLKDGELIGLPLSSEGLTNNKSKFRLQKRNLLSQRGIR